MTDSKSPTDLWIYTNSLGNVFVFIERQSVPNLHGEFHVIEHSAYLEVCKERDTALARIAELSQLLKDKGIR